MNTNINQDQKNSLITKLQALTEKVDAIKCRAESIAQVIIHKDLIGEYESEFSSLYTSLMQLVDNPINQTQALIDEISQKLLRAEQEDTPKENIKKLKSSINDHKKILNQYKKQKAAHKLEFSPIEKAINLKKKELKTDSNHIEKQAEITKQRKLKIAEARHHIEYMEFPTSNENNSPSEHKFIATNPNYKLLNIDDPLAKEITHALKLHSVTAILEELGYILNINPDQLIIIHKSGLKFNYDPDVNESLKIFYASFNKESKSWWLSPREFDYHKTQNLNSYISSRFVGIIDLDNKLVYTLKQMSISNDILERRLHPKITLSPHNQSHNKESLSELFDFLYTQTPSRNPLLSNKGASIYSPISKQFETFKKSSTISTKIPELLFRFSTLGEVRFIRVNTETKTIEADITNSNQRYEILKYRHQLIGITPDDFYISD